MTGHDDTPEGIDAAMNDLFERAARTSAAENAMGFLTQAHLLERIAPGDFDAVNGVLYEPAGNEAARREWGEMSTEDQDAMQKPIAERWKETLWTATHRLWHACAVTGDDPYGMDADHVALTAVALIYGAERRDHQEDR